MKDAVTTLVCRCGQVKLQLTGQPIWSTDCTCNSCQAAGRVLARLPGGEPLLDDQGATRLVLYRKDRLGCVSGDAWLKEHRLRPESPTRRVVATCCNSAMFLDFTQGHWVDIYGQRWLPGVMPAPTHTGAPRAASLPGGSATTARPPLAFYGKLLAAWAAMRFRRPAIAFVHGVLDAGMDPSQSEPKRSLHAEQAD